MSLLRVRRTGVVHLTSWHGAGHAMRPSVGRSVAVG